MGSELWLQAATGVIGLPYMDELCLAGFAARTDPLHGVDQPLELNVLLLSSDRNVDPFVIVSGDLLYFGAVLRNAVRSRLSEHGLDPNHLLLLASHTHNAPATDGSKPKLGAVDTRFVAYLAAAVTNLVMEARGRAPVRSYMRYTRVRAAHALHRRRLRWRYKSRPPFVQREAYMGPNPLYRLRDDADVVLFESTEAEPLACFWSYACHPSAYPRKQYVHADYVGVVRAALRRRLGNGLPVVFAQGAAGDIRADTRTNRPSLVQRIRAIHKQQRLFTPFSVATWSIWAGSLAERVTAVLDEPQRWSRLEPCLRHGQAKVLLSELIDAAVLGEPALRLVAFQLSNSFRMLVMSAEPVQEYRRIFSSGDVEVHMVVGYEGSVFGYLPTEQMLRHGGYEARGFFQPFGLTGSFQPGFEAKVVRAGRHALYKASGCREM